MHIIYIHNINLRRIIKAFWKMTECSQPRKSVATMRNRTIYYIPSTLRKKTRNHSSTRLDNDMINIKCNHFHTNSSKTNFVFFFFWLLPKHPYQKLYLLHLQHNSGSLGVQYSSASTTINSFISNEPKVASNNGLLVSTFNNRCY